MYSFGMVMIEFSLFDCVIFWEGEFVNFVFIYDYICRGERLIVKEENLIGLSDDNVRLWMRFFCVCWDQDFFKRLLVIDVCCVMKFICVLEIEDDYKMFEQWCDENLDLQFVLLSNYQGVVLEFMDEVVSFFIFQNKLILEDFKKDFVSNF